MNGEGKPVVALDIDGTLGDYHANFLEFACRYFDNENFRNMIGEPNPGLPLWQHMGIPERDYRDAKLAYRQGGWKRWMPVYPAASSLTRMARHLGAEVWLCTTRPYLRLDNVDPDTREWLRRNEIEYDALLFDPVDESVSKYAELVRQVGRERIVSVVEDLPEMITEASRLSIPVASPGIIRSQPYNLHLDHAGMGWNRARNLADVLVYVRRAIASWKEANEV